MINIIYRAETVGPVCQRVARESNVIQVIRDNKPVPSGTIVRWGSVWPADGNVRRSINSAEAVAVAQDKIESRKRLGDLSPATFFRKQDLPNPSNFELPAHLEQLPLIIRPQKHHAGKRFFVCKTQLAVKQALRKCPVWYATTLVDKASEYRVFVCQGRIVAVSERFPAPNAVGASRIAWNLALGGRLINVRYSDWPVPVCKASILAAERLGLDWCAIDIAVDVSGNVFVFEANTAPGLRNPFTIQQIAKVFSWINEHDTPIPSERDRWQNLRHPALQQ